MLGSSTCPREKALLPWFSGVALLPGSGVNVKQLLSPSVVRGRLEKKDSPLGLALQWSREG